MVANMLRYWEKQTKGPVVITAAELQRWQSTTTEQVRKAQRKLLRFYQILSTNYENAIEFSFHTERFKVLLDFLKDTGHFLVVPTNSTLDAFIIADPSLIDEPHVIEELLKGYSNNNKSEFDELYTPKYIILFRLVEPLAWEGPIVEMTLSTTYSGSESSEPSPNESSEKIYSFSDALDLEPGRMRLISEGGTEELKRVREQLASKNIPLFDNFEVIADPIAQLAKVNYELSRMRKLLYKASASVVTDACSFARHLKAIKKSFKICLSLPVSLAKEVCI